MSGNFEAQDEASTPLTPEEYEQLIPSYISLRSELNAAEQANILQATQWAFKKKRNVLDEYFLKTLHKYMFNEVWSWAGKFRQSARNIGVEAYRIPEELRQLIGDCQYWIEHQTYHFDEISARFHHRLVLIHPFPNGNGRHARLATDLLLASFGHNQFTWGSNSLVNPTNTRSIYVTALQAADKHDIQPLLNFVRA